MKVRDPLVSTTRDRGDERHKGNECCDRSTHQLSAARSRNERRDVRGERSREGRDSLRPISPRDFEGNGGCSRLGERHQDHERIEWVQPIARDRRWAHVRDDDRVRLSNVQRIYLPN